MYITSKNLLLVAALAALTALAAPTMAEEHGGHEGHDMSAMTSSMSMGDEDGSWSYGGRENPTMQFHERWEMVPAAGRAGEAIAASALSRAERCTALMAAEDLMHDHATRAACRGINPTENQQQSSQHHDMDHGDMDHGDMDHGDMDHGDMDHGDMDHGDMDHDN
jgi:hypothetical protein